MLCGAKTDPAITWEEAAACPSRADGDAGEAGGGHDGGKEVWGRPREGGSVRYGAGLALINSSRLVRAVIRPHCRYLISFLRIFGLLAARLVGGGGESEKIILAQFCRYKKTTFHSGFAAAHATRN